MHARAGVWLARSRNRVRRTEAAATALAAVTGLIERMNREHALELEAEALTLARVELAFRGQVDERLPRFERRAAGSARFEPIARHPCRLRGNDAGRARRRGGRRDRRGAGGRPAVQSPTAFGMAIDALVNTERQMPPPAGSTSRSRCPGLGLGARLAGLHAQRALLGLAAGAVGQAELDMETALRPAAKRPRSCFPGSPAWPSRSSSSEAVSSRRVGGRAARAIASDATTRLPTST